MKIASDMNPIKWLKKIPSSKISILVCINQIIFSYKASESSLRHTCAFFTDYVKSAKESIPSRVKEKQTPLYGAHPQWQQQLVQIKEKRPSGGLCISLCGAQSAARRSARVSSERFSASRTPWLRRRREQPEFSRRATPAGEKRGNQRLIFAHRISSRVYKCQLMEVHTF